MTGFPVNSSIDRRLVRRGKLPIATKHKNKNKARQIKKHKTQYVVFGKLFNQ